MAFTEGNDWHYIHVVNLDLVPASRVGQRLDQSRKIALHKTRMVRYAPQHGEN